MFGLFGSCLVGIRFRGCQQTLRLGCCGRAFAVAFWAVGVGPVG